jgi:hypothetical protein
MPTLPNKINRPMFIAPLQKGKLQIGQLPRYAPSNRCASSSLVCIFNPLYQVGGPRSVQLPISLSSEHQTHDARSAARSLARASMGQVEGILARNRLGGDYPPQVGQHPATALAQPLGRETPDALKRSSLSPSPAVGSFATSAPADVYDQG